MATTDCATLYAADFEILTLLFQRVGQPGLEVCAGKGVTRGTVKSEGKWIPMDPMPGCITCTPLHSYMHMYVHAFNSVGEMKIAQIVNVLDVRARENAGMLIQW